MDENIANLFTFCSGVFSQDYIQLFFLLFQCTAEVNSLRARRIEILQGMQGTVD